MQTSVNRAIKTNSLNGSPFPIHIDFSVKSDIYRINLVPMSILEMIELIPLTNFLVFNVNSHEYDERGSFTLTEIADKYSSYLKSFDEETILMDKESIICLLNEISHYNFCLISTEPEINLDKVIQIIDLADQWNKITVIEEIPSNFFLCSHDDCYLYLETNDKNLAFELIALQIKTLVAEFSDCLINELIFNPSELITEDDFSIVIPQISIKSEEKVSWKVLNGTFKDLVYANEMTERDKALVFYKANNEIKITN